MATNVEFFNQYFGDSDSEAEFFGFDAVELDEIDHRNEKILVSRALRVKVPHYNNQNF
jgi:hypothetical protein